MDVIARFALVLARGPSMTLYLRGISRFSYQQGQSNKKNKKHERFIEKLIKRKKKKVIYKIRLILFLI